MLDSTSARASSLRSPTTRSAIRGIQRDTSLGERLARMARGRSVTIDYFATRRCSVTVGDLTAGFVDGTPHGSVELATIGVTRVYARPRLVPVLRDAGARLELTRSLFGTRLVIWLDRPELWLDFLDAGGHSPRPRSARH